MSGGSLNYLCYAETPEIMSRVSDMESVENTLLSMKYNDIAKDVRRLIEYCNMAHNRIEVLREQLYDVFHAVEWYDSADYSTDSLVKVLEEYRTKNDIVSVTRCCKCKRGHKQLPIDKNEGDCYKCELDDLVYNADDFCSYGEPKEEAK